MVRVFLMLRRSMYKPSDEVLKRYADLLIKFALGGGEGIKSGEVVFMMVPMTAHEFMPFLRQAVLEAGGHPMFGYTFDDQRGRDFYDLGSDEQIGFAPEKYFRGLVDQIDHVVRILAEKDKYTLKGVDSSKIVKGQGSLTTFRKMYIEKEKQGKLTWVLASYGTEAEADDAGMKIEEYWDQIIKACYLDIEDPVLKWREIATEQHRVMDILDEMKIEKVHVESENVDLWVQLGSTRQWLGGRGRNIPSFELFVTPDWRGTQGKIKFNVPLYRYGNKIDGIAFEFKDGVIVTATAEENESLLKNIVSTLNADKIGEFSLTDRRLSRIDRFMGQTLYDENYGGEYGNTHIAVGMGYVDSYRGDVGSVSRAELDELGFNDSTEHTDMFSTENRKVTAYLPDGSTKVIYENGEFTV
jgi:aminopeptidase